MMNLVDEIVRNFLWFIYFQKEERKEESNMLNRIVYDSDDEQFDSFALN